MNYEKETTSIPTYACSGYDGIGIGLKRAIPNLRTIAHVEIETYAIANLIAKMEAGQLDSCPVFTDLKEFPYRELRDRVTILSAGFPCQPFSSAGKRQATGDARHLYPWIANGITAMRPRYIFLENVEGIISAKTGDKESVLKYVLRDLESRGYTCTWGIFSAEEVGAPHRRKRVFILGHTSSVGSCGGRTDEGRQQSEVLGSGLEPVELAYSTSREPRQSQARNGGQGTSRGSEETRWPARPGEEQYDWEEPRVVADRTVKRCGGRKNKDRANGEGLSEQEGEERSILRSETEGCCGDEQTETQSGLGRTANGVTHRVDRIRLLGNGVVPDTCELAFKTLIKQL